MKRSLAFGVLCCVPFLFTVAIFGQSAEKLAPKDDPTSVQAVMRNIRAAAAEGDFEKWKALVDEKCIFVEPTGRRTARDWHIPSKTSAKSAITVKTDLSNIAVQLFGDTALLTYVETSDAAVGENALHTVTRYTETYQRSSGAWRMIASAETPVPQRQAVKFDAKVLDDYLGEYQVAPGLIGTVYREGDKLLLIGTGWKQPYELLPLGHDAFFVKGFENTEIVFVRDSTGSVTEHVSRADGHEMVAKRLKRQ